MGKQRVRHRPAGGRFCRGPCCGFEESHAIFSIWAAVLPFTKYGSWALLPICVTHEVTRQRREPVRRKSTRVSQAQRCHEDPWVSVCKAPKSLGRKPGSERQEFIHNAKEKPLKWCSPSCPAPTFLGMAGLQELGSFLQDHTPNLTGAHNQGQPFTRKCGLEGKQPASKVDLHLGGKGELPCICASFSLCGSVCSVTEDALSSSDTCVPLALWPSVVMRALTPMYRQVRMTESKALARNLKPAPSSGSSLGLKTLESLKFSRSWF